METIFYENVEDVWLIFIFILVKWISVIISGTTGSLAEVYADLIYGLNTNTHI